MASGQVATVKVSVIGSSGTFPTAVNPASGYLIESRGTRVWCDAGPGTFTRLPVDNELVDAVFISHRHPDHCTDIFTAHHAWTYRPEPRTGIPLYANGDVLDHLAAFIGRTRRDLFGKTFDVQEVGGGDTVDIGFLQVEFYEANHSAPDLASRWTGEGRTLFYTGDTAPGDWERHAAGASLLLAEASLPQREGEYVLHMTAREAGQIARDQGVDSLVLTHIPPYVDPSRSVADAESAFGRPVGLATPGTKIRV